jgi:hypothetical protein
MSMVTTLLGRLNTTTRLPDQVPLPQRKLNGNGGNGAHHHRRRPQLLNGDRLAAMRAYAGAKFVLDHHVSIADASRWTGSNSNYVAALLEVIATDDAALLRAVLRGHVAVLLAGTRAKTFNRLVAAYQEATPATKAAFRDLIGQERLFDELITFESAPETILETPDKVSEVLEAAE